MPRPDAPSLFVDGCEDEQHIWGEPTVAETSQGTLTGQTCQICGLVCVRLKRPETV